MSTSYGNYLTEEDPNKKKEEGVVPSTMPTTATGGTTTPPLTYEGFIGTGTGSNAYQRGVKYAQGVKDSIYGSAETLREQTDIDTENARQRGIIDSQSSYQKAISAYGSNAETLARRGLSGSGYGEYLTADAYATHRGQVQDINASALEANRKAANLEAQTKMAADSEYLKNLYSLGANLDTAKDTAYSSIFDAVAKGTSLDVVKQSGGWGDLTLEQQQAITAEAEKYTNENAKNETLTNIEDAIANGATLEDVQNMDGWNELSETEQNAYKGAIEDRDEEKEVSIDSVVANLFVPGNEVYSLDDIDTVMRAERVPPEMREEIISRWQSENTDRALAGIEDGSFFENTDPVTFAENIKNGVYGNKGQRVATEYAKVLEASIQEDDVDIVDYAQASYSFDQIKQHLPTAIKNRWETAKGNRLKIDPSFAMSNDSKIGKNPVNAGDRITDETTVAALNQYKTNSKSQLITVGKNTYYRDGDSWSLVVDDMSRPITLTAYHLSNDVSGTGSVKTQYGEYTIDGKRVAFARIDQASKNALKNKYPNPSGMTYVKVGERYYVYMGNDWKYAYTKE